MLLKIVKLNSLLGLFNTGGEFLEGEKILLAED
jgi:hypothetical protein